MNLQPAPSRIKLSSKKKSLELKALRIAPCFAWSLSGLAGITTYRFTLLHQAGLLTHGSPYSPSLPITLARHSGFIGFRPRLQRRDRSRISRDSLLNSQYLMVIAIMFTSSSDGNPSDYLCQVIWIASGTPAGDQSFLPRLAHPALFCNRMNFRLLPDRLGYRTSSSFWSMKALACLGTLQQLQARRAVASPLEFDGVLFQHRLPAACTR
jgi:hypothetical protein